MSISTVSKIVKISEKVKPLVHMSISTVSKIV